MGLQTRELLRESGLKMNKLRELLNYSREQMASYFKITGPAYWKNEKGETFPGIGTLSLLSADHDISMDWFIFNKGPMNYKEKGRPGELEAALEELKGELERERQEHKAEIEKSREELEREREAHEAEAEQARRELEKEREKHEAEMVKVRQEFGEEREKHEAELQKVRQEAEKEVEEKAAEMELKPEMRELFDHMERIPLLYHEVLVHFQRFKKDNREFVVESMDPSQT